MPVTLLTQKDIKFIIANRLTMSGTDMATKIGVGRTVVTNYLRKNGLSVPKEVAIEFRRASMKGRTTSTPKIDKFLKANYLDIPVKAIAKKIGKSHYFVAKRLEQLELIIPEELRIQRKQSTMFTPGLIPANKGKKMPKELYERIKHTFYQKGHIPTNAYDRDGVISLRKDSKSDRYYQYIRVELGRWVLHHKYIYEKEFGPIPPNHCLWFKDGDTSNVKLSNIELITKAENMARNSSINIHPELKQTVKLINKLKKEIKQYERTTSKAQH